jgi:cytochrome c
MNPRRVQLIISSLLFFAVVAACAVSPASISVGSIVSTVVATSLPVSGSTTTQPPTSATSDHGTPADAIAMLKKAVEHYKSAGRTQALADFTNRVAPFFDRDLYVACIDSHLIQSANGGYPNLVGSPIEPISRAAWDSASTTTIGSVDYAWLDPATGTTEPKTFYYEKVGSDVCGVGAYHP